jgi:hypothetical protein
MLKAQQSRWRRETCRRDAAAFKRADGADVLRCRSPAGSSRSGRCGALDRIRPRKRSSYREPSVAPADGFLWLDVGIEETREDPEKFRAVVQRLTSARIDELHLQDATNPQHPSYFDSTREYDMLVFRKLVTGGAKPLEEASGRADKRRMLQEIVTRPITFFIFDRLLLVPSGGGKQDSSTRQRILIAPAQRCRADRPGACRGRQAS